MLFMVIERFKEDAVEEVYRRFAEKGRMMPAEVKYIDSWVENNFNRCFQLIEAQNEDGIREWISNWNDLVDFEVIPVMSSKEAQQNMSFK